MAKKGIVKKTALKDDDERPIRWKKYPHLFLIVCEDEKVEPYYFELFQKEIPPETIFLRTTGTAKSTVGVVQEADVERRKLAEESNKIVDEVWAVFDKDDAQLSVGNTERFEKAFTLAEELLIDIAYSNEVFELWLLLHLTDVSLDKAIPRNEIYALLQDKITKHPAFTSYTYTHGNTSVVDAIVKIGSEKKAIERASKLLEHHQKQNSKIIDSNPSTLVFKLVSRLRELIAYYDYKPD